MPALGSTSKKADKPSGVGGFFGNLLDDVKDLAGVPAGLRDIGMAAYRDAGRAVGARGGNFELDDIGGAIVDSYKYTYGPAFHGNFGTTGSRIYDNPLGPILDAGALFTGGGALVGKAGLMTAKTAGRAGFGGSLVGKAGAKAAGLDAATFAPRLIPIRGLDGNQYGTRLAHTNPAIRMRQGIRDQAYKFIPEKVPLLGQMNPVVRGTRLEVSTRKSIANRDKANVVKKLEEAVAPLSGAQKDAAWYRSQGFGTPERLAALTVARKAELEKTTKGLDELDGKAKAKRQADANDIKDDIKAIERSVKHLNDDAVTNAVKGIHVVSDLNQKMLTRRHLREGLDAEEISKRIRTRAEGPLDRVGIKPDADERLAIITHHGIIRGRHQKKRGRAPLTGLTERAMKEDLQWTGEAWDKARYNRDPLRILDTYAGYASKEMVYENIQHAMSLARVYDPDADAAGVASGKLHLLEKDDDLLNLVDRVDSFIEDQLKPELKTFSDPEFDALQESYTALLKVIREEETPGVVMPKGAYDELNSQFTTGNKVINAITDNVGKLTKTWRHTVLSLKGSFYVNNFIGNMLLGIIAYGPRYAMDVAAESLPARLRGAKSKRIGSEVSDITRTTGTASVIKGEGRSSRFNIIDRLGEAALRQGVKLTEDNFRRAGIRAELRRSTKQMKLEAARRGEKLSTQQAVDMIFNDKQLLEQTARNMYGNLLDYSKLTPFEREILLPLMPFWNFTRSMTGRTVRLYMDEPWKAQVLQIVGEHGIEVVEDEIGEVPEYLKGVLLGERIDDQNVRALSTFGMNPFVAPVDLAEQVFSLGQDPNQVGSMNPLVGFNPIWKVPAEAITGKDFFQGSEIHGSYYERAMQQARKNIPQIAYYDKWVNPAKRPNMIRSGQDSALAYGGLPVGTLNIENVQLNEQYRQDKFEREQAYQEKRKAEAEERKRSVGLPF